MSKPFVGIAADILDIGINPYSVVGEKYIDAVALGTGCALVRVQYAD